MTGYKGQHLTGSFPKMSFRQGGRSPESTVLPTVGEEIMKSLQDSGQCQIRAPKFNQYQTVMITWNGEHQVKIVKRWFDIDDESWWYEFADWNGKYPEQMMY